MFYETMGRLHAAITNRIADERGQGTVEYIGLMLLIAVLVGAAWKAAEGKSLADTIFGKIKDEVDGLGSGKKG
jgi:hypothetical protein